MILTVFLLLSFVSIVIFRKQRLLFICFALILCNSFGNGRPLMKSWWVGKWSNNKWIIFFCFNSLLRAGKRMSTFWKCLTYLTRKLYLSNIKSMVSLRDQCNDNTNGYINMEKGNLPCSHPQVKSYRQWMLREGDSVFFRDQSTVEWSNASDQRKDLHIQPTLNTPRSLYVYLCIYIHT